MDVKIDFEKAHNRLRQSFIRESLRQLRIPQPIYGGFGDEWYYVGKVANFVE